MPLSPWPTTPVAIGNATAALYQAIIGSPVPTDPDYAAALYQAIIGPPVPTDLTDSDAFSEYVTALYQAILAISVPVPTDTADLGYVRVAALGPVAAAMVERYAPAAPQAIRDEAVVRCAGYLAQADFGTVDSESVGPRTVSHVTNHAAAFRNSGAAGLLSPWRVRRAGLAG